MLHKKSGTYLIFALNKSTTKHLRLNKLTPQQKGTVAVQRFLFVCTDSHRFYATVNRAET
jgi:hypothetical protein